MIAALLAQQRPLVFAGAISFVFFILMVAFTLLDPTPVLGINRWVKPMKFFISIAIFLWTIAVYLHYVRNYPRLSRWLAWSMIIVFAVEMVIIVGQAARGAKSHFNTATPIDAALYAVMGISIVINTLLTATILYLYFKTEINLPRSIVWGMRLGIIVFLLGSIEGGYMSAQLGHSVGVADGGSGLPIANWSTVGGDLRVAHFLGLHALQVVPIFAYLVERFRTGNPTMLTTAFAFGYFVIFTLVFIQALLGLPLFASG